MDIYQLSSDTIVLTSFVDEEVEYEHFGKEGTTNCPEKV
jgi:hypothetical protein